MTKIQNHPEISNYTARISEILAGVQKNHSRGGVFFILFVFRVCIATTDETVRKIDYFCIQLYMK